MSVRTSPAPCCRSQPGWAHPDQQEGMFNLKRIVNGSPYKKAISDFYLRWLSCDLLYCLFFACMSGQTQPADLQNRALVSDNLCWIFHNPNFISSYARTIRVVLEGEKTRAWQYNFPQMFVKGNRILRNAPQSPYETQDWSKCTAVGVPPSFPNCSLCIGATGSGRGRWSPTGVEPGPHKINSGLWSRGGSGVGGEGGTHVWHLLTFSWGRVWSFKPPRRILGAMNIKGGGGVELGGELKAQPYQLILLWVGR